MTMLDRMRRHKGWLKWSLALVCLTFVFFYVPGFLDGNAGSGMPGEAVAKVDGQAITVRDFTLQLNRRMQMFRGQGGNISDQMLKQLGIDRQVLQELIDEQAMLAEANRLGLSVRDAEVRAQILNFPAFQENGQFIGEDRYRALLRMQRPPMTPADFEEAIRKDLLREKLQSAVTGWVAGSITDTDVEEEYRRRNEKVKLEVVSFQADAFKAGLAASDDEIASRLRRQQGALPHRREAQGALRADRHAGAAADDQSDAAGNRAGVSGQHPAVPRSRAGARVAHPAEDRGQG